MKNIATALVKAQKAFGPALKSSTNPHFKSKYADLAACVEAVIDGLNSAGIMLMQQCHESDSGVTVETIFVHESGEMLSAGKLHVPAAKQDPQGYGSALTYARRYSLMAACGIAPEDDDGNAAKAPQRKQTGVKADYLSQHPPIAQERQDELDELALLVKDDLSAYGAQAAFERLQEVGLEDVEKIYLSTRLTPAEQRAIKEYSQAFHKKVKEPA